MRGHDHQQHEQHGHGHGHGEGHRHGIMPGLAGRPGFYNWQTGLIAGPLYRRIAAEVAARNLPPGSLVIDLGTGPGQVPLRIARSSPGLRVEGIDLSPEMIRFATEQASAAGLPPEQVRFRTADVSELPYDDATVNLVVSSLSLHHWADAAVALREITRVLRPGGEAWIYDLRSVLTHLAPDLTDAGTDDLPPGVTLRVEQRLRGAWRINPMGRLIVSC